MTAFAFSLEALLRMRRMARDQQQRAVAEQQRKLQDVLHQLASMDRSLREEVSAARYDRGEGAADMQVIRSRQYYVGVLQQQMVAAQEKVTKAKIEVVRQQQLLAKSVAKVRALEKLRDRQFKEFMVQLNRAEQSELDDVAVSRFIRGQQSMDTTVEING